MTEPATAIFVHGGWHDGWSWHLVQELLNERGVVIETETATVIDKQASLEVFYHDVDPALAQQAAARLRPFQKTGYEVVHTELAPAWQTTPTTYVVCANDRMIHPDNQRDMAAAAGAEVVEWPTSHSPFLSRPDLVARLVATRAMEVTA